MASKKLDFDSEIGKLQLEGLRIMETHCHLDYLKQDSLEQLLVRARAVGIGEIITISVSPSNLQAAFKIATSQDGVFCTQGIHPHEAHHWSQELKLAVQVNLAHKKVVAVGEIGLDYYYNKSPREIQIKAFREQLELAVTHQLPVVIHTRDAEHDTIDILKEFAPSLSRKGVLHSFTSSMELAEKALELGFHLGINGIVTFKTADNVREVLRVAPIDRILLETDAPFLTPLPFRGKENAPHYLPFVAKKVVEEKGCDASEALKTIYTQSLKLFGI